MPRLPMPERAGIHIYMPQSQKDRLIKRAIAEKKSPSQLIRELLEATL